RPKRILELGCGRALSGLYAAKLFPEAQVALTDVSEECLESARANAVVNACDNVEATFLNWHSLDPELPNWDLVIAADVLYLERAVKVLPKALQATLAYDGLALIVDPDRCY
ncbi:S-adenosyl-L-methionine-dependent methyltransferase, partial [Chytriomyces sp. MP71]